eukprot:GHVN01097652.1.p1 GENE.GHVN01097652.1~~GHVN01097652.1.p1  ORF type:complete len:489 (-),score=43.46 GHVN01097652.1:110-1423(-)
MSHRYEGNSKVGSWVGWARHNSCCGISATLDKFVYYTNTFRTPSFDDVVITCACETSTDRCTPNVHRETLAKKVTTGLETKSSKLQALDACVDALSKLSGGSILTSNIYDAGAPSEMGEARIVFEAHANRIPLYSWPDSCTATPNVSLHQSEADQGVEFIARGCPVLEGLDFRQHHPAENRFSHSFVFSVSSSPLRKLSLFENELKIGCSMRLYLRKPSVEVMCKKSRVVKTSKEAETEDPPSPLSATQTEDPPSPSSARQRGMLSQQMANVRRLLPSGSLPSMYEGGNSFFQHQEYIGKKHFDEIREENSQAEEMQHRLKHLEKMIKAKETAKTSNAPETPLFYEAQAQLLRYTPESDRLFLEVQNNIVYGPRAVSWARDPARRRTKARVGNARGFVGYEYDARGRAQQLDAGYNDVVVRAFVDELSGSRRRQSAG